VTISFPNTSPFSGVNIYLLNVIILIYLAASWHRPTNLSQPKYLS